mmetsp:Transcript_137921/g.384636  ORF Transcript_137921/g.384636 Transcript_137921/m.384636 type:complete len:140 (+) Transcript_137921:217-636(+)|eukprot:CAMPEP_0179122952 /NCGR_PEP_ID=MMETSP0796-20121207/58047_1 /TAXON_ID=73915 /ORGANISM="Pyrodinium bahamense, Strain pbaha01" /LENGTH=139 /DNA_ID=CAMNT_0020821583 /DNA_START=160 /DNA_END=579 /DNA_ORIENTATION=+
MYKVAMAKIRGDRNMAATTTMMTQREEAGPMSTATRRPFEKGTGKANIATVHAHEMLSMPAILVICEIPMMLQHHLRNRCVSGSPAFDTVESLSNVCVARNSAAAYNLSSGNAQAERSTWYCAFGKQASSFLAPCSETM